MRYFKRFTFHCSLDFWCKCCRGTLEEFDRCRYRAVLLSSYRGDGVPGPRHNHRCHLGMLEKTKQKRY